VALADRLGLDGSLAQAAAVEEGLERLGDEQRDAVVAGALLVGADDVVRRDRVHPYRLAGASVRVVTAGSLARHRPQPWPR
jgi:hypothetical protein